MLIRLFGYTFHLIGVEIGVENLTPIREIISDFYVDFKMFNMMYLACTLDDIVEIVPEDNK